MAWELTGNTTGPNDFLGTINDRPLVIKTNNTERMHVRRNGNVGIGATSPEAKLEVQGSADPLLLIDHTGASGNPALWFQQGGATKAYVWWDQANSRLNLGTPTTNPIVSFRDNGNVGIGSVNPDSKLTVVKTGDESGAASALVAVNRSEAGPVALFDQQNPTSTFFAIQATARGTANVAAFVGLSDNTPGVVISVANGQPGLHVSGGTKSAIVATSQGARALYTEESTEVWFTDYGFGHLQNGHTVIRIDPFFAETVNLDEPYHVFIQAYGNATLYVSQRTPSTFEICLSEGDANVEFSYRLVAKRRKHERTRLERVPSADNDPNLYPEKRPEWEAQHRVRGPA